jgi:hypothetical protein
VKPLKRALLAGQRIADAAELRQRPQVDPRALDAQRIELEGAVPVDRIGLALSMLPGDSPVRPIGMMSTGPRRRRRPG